MGNNEFYKNLIDNSQLGYAYHKIILDENGIPFDFKFLEVNKAFEEILGFKNEDLIGNSLRTIYPGIPEELCDWISFCSDIALKGGNQNIDVYFKTLDKYFNISVHSSDKYYFVVFIIDQTIQKLTEKSIQIQNNRYFTLLQNLNGMVYHCENDKNWTMKFISEGCKDLTGYPPEDLINNKKLSYNEA
jgi:PAS domain S-box-containing protein